ncbi:MAG: AI-2E family transporter [Gammaproteobacteria bacterium]
MSHANINLVSVAALVIILAAAQTAQEIVLPFLLAIFIAIIAAAPMTWLRNKGISSVVAVSLIVLVVILFFSTTTLILTTSIDSFSQMLPGYLARLRESTDQLLQWLSGHGLNISGKGIRNAFDPGAAMNLANTILSGLAQLLSNAFLITLTVVFMLLEASVFSQKIELIRHDGGKTMEKISLFVDNTKSYMGIKTVTSFITGVLVGIGMAILGVDFPLLWGFLAFLLNFIPTIGSIIAAVPAVLLAMVQLDASLAMAVAVFYLAVNMLVGNVLEPRMLGRGVGLSTLVVFLSLVFWGWLFGPVGMLLSVPLTMVVKFATESNEDTRWIATLLSASGPVTAETDNKG